MNSRIESTLTLAIAIGLLLLSKEFIILNELAIVAICFFLFVTYAALTMNNVVKAEFDEKAILIEQEYADYLNKRQEAIQKILNTYKKQINLRSDIKEITIGFRNAMDQIVQNKNESLKFDLQNKVITQLNNIQRREQTFLFELQNKLSQSAKRYLLAQYSNTALSSQDTDFSSSISTLANKTKINPISVQSLQSLGIRLRSK